ncbi:hypothetical protein [Paenibacillus sp. NEAU-GSW1]|uniref:hypothetical protein n=1 Tax=Paenibacillus sp. NEAU-GSW1 TaxID=2682486 RepID=UPI0012E1E315|nr:hypothetical protein [Paenibacillus sp. NEAU-GSW1]MUT66007.1 hypothetical protein [Paenibacillus sp. NEAU-GSW1]
MTKRTELAFTGTHITATVLNYEGIVQFGYNDPVTFEVEGSTFTTNAINGVATMEFDVDPGTYTVRTVNADLANGELIVNA